MTTTIVNPSSLGSTNLLINPAFAVIQKAANGTLSDSLALPTQSLGYEGGTNWCFAASGSSAVAYAIDSASESVTFTGAASTTGIYLLQRLESKDVTTLANKLATVTLSVEISNSSLTSVIWEVFRPTTSNDVHGTIASPTQTLIASGTFTVSSTLTRYSTSFALPALASRGLELRLRVGAQTSGTWTVTRLQLEEGNVATAFNCGDYSSELLKCLRYYQDLGEFGILFSGDVTAGQTYTTKQPFVIPMRTIPQGIILPVSAVGFNNALGSFTTSDRYIIESRIAVGTGAGGFSDTCVLSAHIP